MRNFYKAIPFLLRKLGCLEPWEWVTMGGSKCPSPRIVLNDLSGTVSRNPLILCPQSLWNPTLPCFTKQNSHGHTASHAGDPCPSGLAQDSSIHKRGSASCGKCSCTCLGLLWEQGWHCAWQTTWFYSIKRIKRKTFSQPQHECDIMARADN